MKQGCWWDWRGFITLFSLNSTNWRLTETFTEWVDLIMDQKDELGMIKSACQSAEHWREKWEIKILGTIWTILTLHILLLSLIAEEASCHNLLDLVEDKSWSYGPFIVQSCNIWYQILSNRLQHNLLLCLKVVVKLINCRAIDYAVILYFPDISLVNY